MDVRGQRAPEGTSTLIERPEGWERSVQETVWGEVTAGMEEGVEGGTGLGHIVLEKVLVAGLGA